MAIDVFDDDDRSVAGPEIQPSAGDDFGPGGSINDASLTRLMRQKEQALQQVASATQEIEKLRYRQEALEKERNELQEMCRRQEEYQKNKREIMEKLIQSLVVIEKEESRVSQLLELLGMVRASFKSALNDVKSIDEEKWSEETFQEEMNKAIALVDGAREVYRKGIGKVEAAQWQKEGRQISGASAMLGDSSDILSGEGRGFRYWFWTGTAFFLPLIITIVVLFLVLISVRGY